MSDDKTAVGRTRRLAVYFVIFAAVVGIIFLSFNVTRQIQRIGVQYADNPLWTLSQTEVEFYKFAGSVNEIDQSLSKFRLQFDIFYSRIVIIGQARAFADLRDNASFANTLAAIQSELDSLLPIVDGSDDDLVARQETLQRTVDTLRPALRNLTVQGLNIFTFQTDMQRRTIARLATQLGAAIAALVIGLGITLLYLNRLNTRAENRGRALQQSAKRMNTIITTSLDGVIVMDEQAKVIEFSHAAEEIFGIKADDALGTDFGTYVALDEMPKGRANAGNRSNTRVIIDFYIVGRGRTRRDGLRQGGASFPAEIAIQTADTEEGRIYIAFVRDISRRLMAETELVAARDAALENEKQKTDFLAIMSHEIRTPLNGLLGSLDLIRDTPLNAAQERYMRNMETSGRLLLRHVSDVLDITQYDVRQSGTTPQPLNLPMLIQDIIDTQSSVAQSQRTNLTWRWTSPDVTWITSDPDRLQHALMNLIGNAVKFTKDGRVVVTVSVTTNAPDMRLRIEVADTGPGIQEDMRSKIFDDFVTGDTADDRQFGGTGLGLSIAKRFITALGGEIGVDCPPTGGSIFWIDLPVTAAQDPVTATPKPPLSPILPQRILLIEDNLINRAVAREMLEADGHIVTEASDGALGVAAAEKEFFDIILMDISMPNLDGRAAARRIKAAAGASAKSPIIAVTANALEVDQAKFVADGIIGTITKPITRNALRTALRDQTFFPVTQPEDVIVDLEHLNETKQTVGPTAFEHFWERFNQDVKGLLSCLATDLPQSVEGLAETAHNIGGTAAIFGAVHFRKHVILIENAAKSGDIAQLNHASKTLPIVWEKTRAAMPFTDVAAE